MTRIELLQFMRSHSLAVQASVSPLNAPQAMLELGPSRFVRDAFVLHGALVAIL